MSSGNDRGGLSCAALVAGFLLLCGALGYFAWTSRSTGAECEVDGDCNALACLQLGWGRTGVCTEICRTDEDCPDSMRCDLATRGESFTPGGSAERHVCVPTGARLRELLQ